MKRVAIFVRRTVKKHEKMNVISWFEVLNLDLKKHYFEAGIYSSRKHLGISRWFSEFHLCEVGKEW